MCGPLLLRTAGSMRFGPGCLRVVPALCCAALILVGAARYVQKCRTRVQTSVLIQDELCTIAAGAFAVQLRESISLIVDRSDRTNRIRRRNR